MDSRNARIALRSACDKAMYIFKHNVNKVYYEYVQPSTLSFQYIKSKFNKFGIMNDPKSIHFDIQHMARKELTQVSSMVFVYSRLLPCVLKVN